MSSAAVTRCTVSHNRRVTSYIALLRGINLGSTRKIAMPELRDLLHSLGYADARTYIQSGNILLASDQSPRELATRLERAIEERFKLRVPVLVRTADDLAEVVARNPLPERTAVPARFYVVFLDRAPRRDRIDAIGAADLERDQVAFGNRVIYAWYRDGLRASRLAPAIADNRLGVTTTARNWNTVTRLLDLAGGARPTVDIVAP